MAKTMTSSIIVLLMIFNIEQQCSATTYLVGGNSGWDISTDFDSWLVGKRFMVGDVLWFQYSSYHTVVEVTKDNYDDCNTSNVISSSSRGNTSFTLSQPGQRFFVCGNRMHCLGGMKLGVNVEDNGTAVPAAGPQSGGGGGGGGTATLPPPNSSKSGNPSAVPSSSHNLVKVDLVMISLGILGLTRIIFCIL